MEPFPYEDVERIVSSELGFRLSKGFASFDPEPLASASLGQVHRARMRDGREVVVKVQRPGIRQQVAGDMEALAEVAAFADAHQSEMRTSSGSMFSSLLEARDFVEQLPGRVDKVMDAVADGNFELTVHAIDEAELMRGFQKLANRLTMGVLLASLVVGAAMLMRIETDSTLLGYPAVAIVCFLAAASGGVALMASIVHSDRQARNRPGRKP